MKGSNHSLIDSMSSRTWDCCTLTRALYQIRMQADHFDGLVHDACFRPVAVAMARRGLNRLESLGSVMRAMLVSGAVWPVTKRLPVWPKRTQD
jgi:hypothetical protein